MKNEVMWLERKNGRNSNNGRGGVQPDLELGKSLSLQTLTRTLIEDGPPWTTHLRQGLILVVNDVGGGTCSERWGCISVSVSVMARLLGLQYWLIFEKVCQCIPLVSGPEEGRVFSVVGGEGGGGAAEVMGRRRMRWRVREKHTKKKLKGIWLQNTKKLYNFDYKNYLKISINFWHFD